MLQELHYRRFLEPTDTPEQKRAAFKYVQKKMEPKVDRGIIDFYMQHKKELDVWHIRLALHLIEKLNEPEVPEILSEYIDSSDRSLRIAVTHYLIGTKAKIPEHVYKKALDTLVVDIEKDLSYGELLSVLDKSNSPELMKRTEELRQIVRRKCEERLKEIEARAKQQV